MPALQAALRGETAATESVTSQQMWEVKDKQGIVFTLTDRPGILNEALKALANHEIDLTRIESKPSKFYKEGKPWLTDRAGA